MRSPKVLADIIDSAIGAKTHFDVWWTQASQGGSGVLRAKAAHRDFFSASENAHYVAFFVYFGQLFDKRADASSIKNYLKISKPTIDELRSNELNQRYEALVKRAEPLLKVRHFRVAHVNAQLTEEEVFVPLKITWFQIRDTIYDSADFVAELAGVKQGGEVGIPRHGRLEEATNALFKALRPRSGRPSGYPTRPPTEPDVPN